MSAFNSLPQPVQNVCVEAAGSVLADALGGAWSALTKKKDAGAIFAKVYQQWREDVEAGDEQLRTAFEEFFCDQRTVTELRKVLDDRYREIDFILLERVLREKCERARCPVPRTDLHLQLDGWVRDLQALLEELPEYRQRYQLSLQGAIRELSQSEAVVRNYSRARKLYLEAVARQHRYIRFSGMAEVSGPAEVEMTKVFVMPRVVRQPEVEHTRERKPRPISADQLLRGKKPAGRVVILGGPGSGKTTLLECFALALAQRRFKWAEEAPDLLPVFYRIRDLDRDLEENPGSTIWDCLRRHCSQRMGVTLPAGFFHQQMDSGGLLVLLDGLDEAGSPGRRNRIVDLVSAFVETLSPESRAVITSRPHDYARRRFDPESYQHFNLCEFDDEEIQTFIKGWRLAHEPDRKAATEKAEHLWKALEQRRDIQPLARNALLLTMIVRVHFGLGALPDSRLDLYAKCAETLLKHWAEAKDLPPGPIDRYQKEKFLGELAFDLQTAHREEMTGETALLIERTELAKRLDGFLKTEAPGASTEELIERLHARDAILVQYGGDRFGFVHRSFQEYFGAWWMANELEDEEFTRLVFEEPPGWNETLYLAVAQLKDQRRRRMLVELLRRSRIEFAVACLKTAARLDLWLKQLIQFLSRCYWAGEEYAGLTAAECAESCGGRAETLAVLSGLFDRETRDGRALASAAELAEELARRGVSEARALLDEFFAESRSFGLDSAEKMAWVDGFHFDRYLVTNRDYECLVPSHRRERGEYSDADDQPVIYVSWHEANLYCRWRGPGFRLPAEEEWYKAAAWDPERKTNREYPWGDKWDASRCNTSENGPAKTTPVGAYPEGASAYGCYDMAGNVWEWTASRWSEGGERMVLRGGAWSNSQSFAACAFRSPVHPRPRDYGVGFRCAGT